MRTLAPDALAPPEPPQDHTDPSEQQLLSSVAEVADLLTAEAPDSDARGRLSARSVEALRSRGLWRLRLCRELGGLELPITSQIRVLAALAAEDTASAWCSMVANSSVAVLGATMPDAAVRRVFADGVPACSIVAAPGGKAVRVEGGHRLTGTWRLASGIHHAQWVHAAAHIDGDPSRLLPFAIPAHEVEVLDSWHVIGLAGTGSNDFRLVDHFLPDELAGRADNPYGQLRGSRRYDLIGFDRIEAYEHLAFALGVTRRALAELRMHLAALPPGKHTGDREVVQSQLGLAVLQMQGIEAHAMTVYGRIDAAAAGTRQAWLDQDVHVPRALAAHATRTALDATHLAFQRAGATALHGPNILEKLLRDMSVAATHVMVDDVATARYGQHLLETADLAGERPWRTESHAR
ncbi:MAG TPA: hypothetical protein VGE11_07420 [Pseudonocardia sp.]